MIGTSVGLALRGQGHRLGYDPNPEHAQKALALGAVDALMDQPDEEEGAVVFLCGPPKSVLEEVKRPTSRARLVLDVASVKRPIVEAAAGGGLPFVGGHPLAGCELEGPEAGRADMFAARPFFLVPVPGRHHLLPQAEEVVRRLQAIPYTIGAEEHDAMLAVTSHLPYVLALALLRLAEPIPDPAKGPGFDSLTRPGRSPIALWRQIVSLNRDAVERAWQQLRREVEAFVHADD